MAYTRVNWQNNISTPINADKLNIMDLGISDHETRLTSVSAKAYERKFNPILSNFITNGKVNSSGVGVAQTEAEMLATIQAIKNQGFDSIQVVSHLGVNGTGVFMAGDISGLNYILTQCQANGLGISCVKVHGAQASSQLDLSTILANMTIEDFKTQWQAMCVSIANVFVGKSEKFIVLNELDYFYTDSTYDTFVSSLLNAIKALGFEAGISTINYNSFLKMTDNNKNLIDFCATNWYPVVTTKGLNATVDIVKSALANDYIHQWIKYCSEKFPTKDIIITETGIVDVEQALIDGWQWAFTDNTTHGGAVQDLFLKGLLEVFKNSKVKSINLWWEWESDLTKATIGEYLHGGSV